MCPNGKQSRKEVGGRLEGSASEDVKSILHQRFGPHEGALIADLLNHGGADGWLASRPEYVDC